MKQKIQKDEGRNLVVATRLTRQEHKILKKLCKENKITFARLVRYSLEQTLNNNLVPTMPK